MHILAGLTLYGIVRRTLCLPSMPASLQGAAIPLALTISALWTVHPLQTESVTYIVQRTEALVGLFYLLTLYAAIRSATALSPRSLLKKGTGSERDIKNPGELACREVPVPLFQQATRSQELWGAGAVAACLCGMASKEVMVSAPLIVASR